MQKSKTAAWKALSTRNRHNGRTNSDVAMMLLKEGVERYAMSDRKEYFRQVIDYMVPNYPEPIRARKCRIVRAKA